MKTSQKLFISGLRTGLVGAGLNIIKRRYFSKIHRFDGDAKSICEQIIKETWNGLYYQTGLGHFNYFWIRDFGIVTESLIRTGNGERVRKTIKWALGNYISKNKVTLSIDTRGNVFDAPSKSIDALSWLIYSIFVSKYILSETDKKFLEKEIERFYIKFIDPKTDLLKDNIKYSELRDAAKYKQSSYAILMIYILSFYSKKLQLDGFNTNPDFYKNLLINEYWNGKYFNSDINNKSFSADSNLLPFILGVFIDKEMLASVLKEIKEQQINTPFPMKYTDKPDSFKYHWWAYIIMPDYASNTVWTWMGLLYLKLLKDSGSKDYKTEYSKFTQLIDRYKTFPELLHPDGSWYKTIFYKAEEGMIWSAIYNNISE